MLVLFVLMPTWSRFSVVSALVLGGAIASSGNYALGQIASDNTLGTESSRITSPDSVNFQIDDGATRGTNLFHSFSQFSVPTNGSAYFNNRVNIQNIITRVTGGSVSNIDGLIKAHGTANLFLINPNGIIFGPNASLNISGSFLTSTASSLSFADGTQFSATPTQTTPLLTISVPLGLQYGSNAGSIQVQGSKLQVLNGKTLALLGGNVQLNGAFLQALGGRVELGGVAGTETVGLSVSGNNLGLSFPVGVAHSDVSLINRATVDVTAGGGGTIAINVQNLNMAGGSELLAGIDSGLGASDSRAGNIEIHATGAINLTDGSLIDNSVLPGGVGKGGNINITTRSLSLTDGALLETATWGQGDAGSVTIAATDSVFFDGVSSNNILSSGVISSVEAGAGNGGDINITTRSLSVTNGARLQTRTKAQGDAGSVTINASENVSFDGVGSNGFSSAAAIQVSQGAQGNGGNINITTRSLSVTSRARLDTTTFGLGDVGGVNINASEMVSFDGGGALSRVAPEALGTVGGINITTGSLDLSNGALLSASTFGRGKAGNVTINARDRVSVDSSFITSSVEVEALGKGGDIDITTGSLILTNGARLSTSTFGQGKAGNVTINARDRVSFEGVDSNLLPGGAFSRVEAGAVGNGGNIYITTGSLAVTNGAQVGVNTRGEGNAGNAILNVRDSVSLDGVGRSAFTSRVASTVENTAIGNGGDINITAGSLFVTNGAEVSASTSGQGNAGRITLQAVDTVSLATGSTISSAVETGATGKGGNIDIIGSRTLLVRDGASIAVDSQGTGEAGNMKIQADSLTLDNRASISAETASNTGGNITLQVPDLLLMRHGSSISTTAGTAQAGGNGGNIRIDTDFIVAVPSENSDITANAFSGKGGGVTINAQSIFGMVVRSREDLVKLLETNDPTQLDPGRLPTNDITAISQTNPTLSGVVIINTPDVDPTRGLANLPDEPVNNVEVAQGCEAGGKQTSIGFFNTGRGGLAPNPYEPISSSEIWEDVPPPTHRTAASASTASASASPATPPHKIVEAQGWIINEKGEVVLVAEVPATHSQGRCRLR